MRNTEQLSHALCVGHENPDLWYDEDREEEAAAICLHGGPNGTPCPALAACLDIGTDPSNQTFTKIGVWGGLNDHKRNRIRAQRKRATDRYRSVTLPAQKCHTQMARS